MYFVSIGVQPTPCQDESGSLFDTALPDINSSNAMFLPAGDGNKPKGDGDPTADQRDFVFQVGFSKK